MSGSTGRDELYGFSGNDALNGGLGRDALVGGHGNDWLGFTAADLDHISEEERDSDGNVYGDGGADDLFGGADNDQLYGGSGVNRLYGEAGNDILVGGQGRNILSGGVVDLSQYYEQGVGISVQKTSADQLVLSMSNGERLALNGWAHQTTSLHAGGQAWGWAELVGLPSSFQLFGDGFN